MEIPPDECSPHGIEKFNLHSTQHRKSHGPWEMIIADLNFLLGHVEEVLLRLYEKVVKFPRTCKSR